MDWETEARTGREFLKDWLRDQGGPKHSTGGLEKGARWLDEQCDAPPGTMRSIVLSKDRKTRIYIRQIAMAVGMPVIAVLELDEPIRDLVRQEQEALATGKSG